MLTIDYRSGESLYIQIKDNFKKLILSESLRQDDLLPSVRNLASSLTINVNTVQRAYRELEQEGYIYSIPGKGNFVAKIDKGTIKKGMEEFKYDFWNIIKKGSFLGISKNDIEKMVEEFFEGRGENND